MRHQLVFTVHALIIILSIAEHLSHIQANTEGNFPFLDVQDLIEEFAMSSLVLTQKELQPQLEVKFQTEGWEAMLDYLYQTEVKNGYILEERLKENIIFNPYTDERYPNQKFQITINRARPEVIQPTYKGEVISTPSPPRNNFVGQCLICIENVESVFKPALRVYEFVVNNREFFLQFPPFPYFHRHCVIVEKEHTRQIISEITIQDLLEISQTFPGLVVASNTDKLGTGATNLEHRHYQAGSYHFPVFDAKVLKSWKFTDDSDATVSILCHPSAAVKIESSRPEDLLTIASRLLKGWRTGDYSRISLQNDLQTISWICRYIPEKSLYVLILLPRNGQNPRFLTRKELHPIKKEFLGIFEMVGYAIFPGRLGTQLPILESYLSLSTDSEREKFERELHESTLADLQVFKEWFSQFGSNSQKPKIAIREALENSFLTMISDNSPFPYDDYTIWNLWIEASGLNLKEA